MFKIPFRIFNKNRLERIFEKAVSHGYRKILLVWNRGLGDIALGVYGIVQKIRRAIPEAEITILTRKDLEEGFLLLENVQTIAVPTLKRGEPVDVYQALAICGHKKEDFDLIIERVDPTHWLKKDLGRLIPRLKWSEEFDQLWKKFSFHPQSPPHLAIHLHTETDKFYGYNKNWPQDRYREVFESLLREMPLRIILFGLQKNQFWSHPALIDLRGETTILEMLSIIKNCCPLLIAPDGGVLTLLYYLDVSFPITIISLWGDAGQGILKQAVPSPNPRMKHIPIIGANKDIKAIPTETVLFMITQNLGEAFRASKLFWECSGNKN